jgi:hypothetical protein
MFCLRSGLKAAWIDINLLDTTTTEWRSEWFYIVDQRPALLKPTRHKPEKILEWDLPLTSREMDDVKELLTLVSDLKQKGLTGGSLAMSFYRCLIQPIKNWVHPAYEYWGQSYPTHEVNHKVCKEEMAARGTQIYIGCIRNRKCPKAHSLT